MRLLANPLLVKMVVVMAASVFAMIVGVLFIRGLAQLREVPRTGAGRFSGRLRRASSSSLVLLAI